jgi:hypothetical protein
MGLDFGYANKVSRQEGIALIRAAYERPERLQRFANHLPHL